LVERDVNGIFHGLKDFVSRVAISLEQLIILIRIGTFRFTGISKKILLWDAHYLLGHSKKTKPERTLFNLEVKEFQLPELWKHKLEDAFDEIELLGFSLVSPFKLVRTELPSELRANDLPTLITKQVVIVGYLITRKPTRSSNGQVMYFGTWIDLDGNWLDTVHFPQVAKTYPFRGPGCYKLVGKVVEEYDFITLEISNMIRLENYNLDG
jgi:DNA polymerase-3 subunit alpha